MTKQKVSACIVSYGGGDEVLHAAQTLLDCTQGVDLHLYLVDNASPDGTGQQLAEAAFDERVTVCQLPQNLGFGAGHNKVIGQLDSTYHAVINPDVVLDTDVLGALCAYLDAHPEAVMATPRLLFLDGREQYTAKRIPTFMSILSRQIHRPKKVEEHYLMLDEDLSAPREIEFCTGCFFVMRTEIYRQIGGFDESYFMYVEDADITRKAMQCGKVMYVPTTYVYHAWHRDATRKWKNFWMQIGSMLRYWRKWGFRI